MEDAGCMLARSTFQLEAMGGGEETRDGGSSVGTEGRGGKRWAWATAWARRI